MLHYILRNGNIVDEYELHKAYEIATGKAFYYDSSDYSRWLYSLLGKSITRVVREEELTIEDVLMSASIVKAVRVYRDRNGCSLREAKDAVEAIKADMLNGG